MGKVQQFRGPLIQAFKPQTSLFGVFSSLGVQGGQGTELKPKPGTGTTVSFLSLSCGQEKARAEKTMTATDVTGFDAIFSNGFFATFSRFWGARLTKLHINTGEKAKNPVESLQWRRRPEIADQNHSIRK